MSYEQTLEFQSDYQNLDYTNHIRLSALLTHFTNLATTHATSLGMWKSEDYGKYGWIVSKIHLELDQPLPNHNFMVKTIIGKPSRVIFPRYFEIYDGTTRIGACSTIWTLLDLTNRRIVMPSRVGYATPSNDHIVEPCPKPDSIEEVEYTFIEERKVRYSDMDTNKHMNNTKYIDWACDLLPLELYEDHYLKSMDIYYKHEIAGGETVKLYLCNNEDTYYIKGMVEDTECFILKLVYHNHA